MSDLRKTIGANLQELRKKKGLSQIELADKFNYSDKAISKWENGDTIPDIEVLNSLCEFYGVTLDYLTHTENKEMFVKEDKNATLINHIIITVMLVLVIWMISIIIFVFGMIENNKTYWIAFVWAVPSSALLIALINRIFFKNRIVNFVCLSVFVWSLIASIYLQIGDYNLWPIFFIGAPIQVALFLWLNIKFKKKA